MGGGGGNTVQTTPNPPTARPTRVRARRGQATDPHSIAERVSLSFFFFFAFIVICIFQEFKKYVISETASS